MGQLSLALSLWISATPGQRLAVLDLKPQGASPELARTLTGVVVEQAGKTSGFNAISQAEISSLLGVERQRQLLGCGDESCLAEIGGALGAKLVLSGSLGKIGESYVLQLQLVDTSRAVIRARESRTIGGSLDALVAATRDLTHRVLTGKPLETTGRIKLAVMPPGARVIIDGKRIGESPLPAPVVLEQGIHKVHIEANGYVPYDAALDAVAGQTLFNEVELVSTAPLTEGARHGAQSTLGFICLGAAAAAVGAAAYFGLNANSAYSNYKSDIYKAGTYDGTSGLRGALYDQNQTVSYQLPANISFAIAGGLAAIGLGLEIWSLAAPSEPAKHVEVTQ